jgi:hypothetical protein
VKPKPVDLARGQRIEDFDILASDVQRAKVEGVHAEEGFRGRERRGTGEGEYVVDRTAVHIDRQGEAVKARSGEFVVEEREGQFFGRSGDEAEIRRAQ